MAATLTLMASCSKDESNSINEKQNIRFVTLIGNNSRTTTGLLDLAALKTSTDGFAVCTDGLGSPEMDNVVVTYSGSTWTYTNDYYWPVNPSATVSFTAYAPAGTTDVTLSSSGLTATDFISASTVGSQIDLLYAAPANFNRQGSSSGVALTFNHILTQVLFSIITDIPSGDTPLISSIILTVPQNKGSYSNATWTPASASQSYTLFNNNALSSTPVVSTPLLLIPQTLPAGTTANITLSVNGHTSSHLVDLSTLSSVTTWGQGSKVTYNIAFQYSDLKVKFTDPTISNWSNASDGVIY